MKRLKYFYIVCMIIHTLNMMLSCKNNDIIISQTPESIINCDIDEAETLINLNQICDSINIVALSPDKNLVGVVDILHSDDDGIYLTSNNILYAYDWNGEELFNLNRRGRSASDYIEIDDFCLSNRYIAIADAQGRKILLFEKTAVNSPEPLRLIVILKTLPLLMIPYWQSIAEVQMAQCC